MEVQLMEHIRHSLLIDCNKDLIIEKLLNLTLEIISLLTREDYIVVRKSSDHVTEGSVSPVSDRCSPSPVMEVPPPHSPSEERFLEPDPPYRTESDEVPGDPHDVEVSFSMTDYDYSQEHKDEATAHPQPHSSAGEFGSTSPPERCGTPLYSQEYIKEEVRIRTLDYQDDPEHGMFHSQYKEEEASFNLVGSGEGSSRDLPERCETPHYPDCIEEEARIIQQEYQAEPVDEMFYAPCKEEDIPTPISSGIGTGSEAVVQPDGANHGGMEDLPPDLCSGLTMSDNTETPFTWKKNPLSNLNTLPIPYPSCVCGKCPFCKQFQTKQQRTPALKTRMSDYGQNPYFSYDHGDPVTQMPSHTNAKLSRHTSPKASNYGHLSKDHVAPLPMDRGGYVCGQCGKSYIDLKKHMRVHTGEKPFTCPECNKCFSQKSSLYRHQRAHTGVKPYSCSECGKDFTVKWNLEQHKRIHRRAK